MSTTRELTAPWGSFITKLAISIKKAVCRKNICIWQSSGTERGHSRANLCLAFRCCLNELFFLKILSKAVLLSHVCYKHSQKSKVKCLIVKSVLLCLCRMLPPVSRVTLVCLVRGHQRFFGKGWEVKKRENALCKLCLMQYQTSWKIWKDGIQF